MDRDAVDPQQQLQPPRDCICICIYICLHTHIYIYIYIDIYTYTHTYLSIYLSIYLSVYLSICLSIVPCIHHTYILTHISIPYMARDAVSFGSPSPWTETPLTPSSSSSLPATVGASSISWQRRVSSHRTGAGIRCTQPPGMNRRSPPEINSRTMSPPPLRAEDNRSGLGLTLTLTLTLNPNRERKPHLNLGLFTETIYISQAHEHIFVDGTSLGATANSAKENSRASRESGCFGFTCTRGAYTGGGGHI